MVASRFAAAAKLDRIRALDARVELVDGDYHRVRQHVDLDAYHRWIGGVPIHRS